MARTHVRKSVRVPRVTREREKNLRARQLLFHTTSTSPTRRAILSYRRTCRRGDKRQIPTADNELPKRRGGVVKEGHITRRTTRGRATWVFTRWRKKEGCVVCRLSSSYISLGIPAFWFFSIDSTITNVNGDSRKNSCQEMRVYVFLRIFAII